MSAPVSEALDAPTGIPPDCTFCDHPLSDHEQRKTEFHQMAESGDLLQPEVMLTGRYCWICMKVCYR